MHRSRASKHSGARLNSSSAKHSAPRRQVRSVTTSSARRHYATPAPKSVIPDFPNEPAGPILRTKTIPGPDSQAKLKQFDTVTNTGAVHFFTDYENSIGNYIQDTDGNVMLDLFCQISSLPIGYNHPRMVNAMTNKKNLPLLLHRPSLGNLPPADWNERINNSLLKLAPKGLKQVTTMMCGSCSNENAYKQAMVHWNKVRRGGQPPSAEELSSCMNNDAPGSPDISIMSFDGAFHGRMFGCLSTTHSKWVHKLDFPAFKWPMAHFPKVKYPMNEENKEYNDHVEEVSLKEVDQLFTEWSKHSPVAGLVVEPIQAEGGDNHASPAFFRKLQAICAKHGAAFIVDEVQTSGGHTGRVWHHESWDLPTPPDYVTFSKKMMTGGFYYKDEQRVDMAYRIFNTWMGDPSKIVQLEAVAEAIEKDNLLAGAKQTGEYLYNNLQRMANDYPTVMSNVRGQDSGTMIAFDIRDGQTRDKMIGELRNKGVEIGGCGASAIRLRPSLVFQPKHAEQFINILHDVVTMNKL